MNSALWVWNVEMASLPWETVRRQGYVLSSKMRARYAATREKRREKMYDWIRELYGDDGAGIRIRTERLAVLRRSVHDSRAARYHPGREEPKEGGPVAWQYLTPRVERMWRKGELTTDQMKAAVSYVYFYRINFIMYGPGTNMVKMEKVDGGGAGTRAPRIGKAFPIHELLPVERAVLEAALILEVGFKDLPASLGDSRITRHRTGRSAFISALTAFHRLNQTLLTT